MSRSAKKKSTSKPSESSPNWRFWLLVLALFAWVPLSEVEDLELDEGRESVKLFRVFRKFARGALFFQALGMFRIYAGLLLARIPKVGNSDLQTVLHFAFPEPTWSALITWFTLAGTAVSLFTIYVKFLHVLQQETQTS